MFLNLRSLAIFVAVGAEFAAAAWTNVTAESAWAAMNPGWNLGNTLDAIPDETSWGNPLVTATLLDSIKAAGINSIRLPVTWTDHFSSQAPDYLVTTAWMDRVEQITNWSLERGFWVVLNVHHDSWQWADMSSDTDLDLKIAKFEALWKQIAARFKDKSEKLILESLNEPPGSTQAHAERYNDLNQRFVNIVRASGGNNGKRLLTLPGLATNIQKTVDWFTVPTNAAPYILHVHDYDPWDFVSTSWGRTFWGTAADKQAIEDTFIALQNRFHAPALIGEWGLTGKSVENAAGWVYFDFFVRTSRAYNLTAQLWDNGLDHFDRTTLTWRDPVKADIIQKAVKGISNSLPAYDQTAALYFKSGATLAATNINLVFNGNTISSVVNASGMTMKKGTDYTVTTAGITISKAYLTTALSGSTLGVRDTLTIKFSAGISLPFELRLYTTPTLGQTSYTLSSTTDLSIPFDGKGSTLATVKALRADGTYLKEDWTQYLGDLQKARINWGDFDVSGTNIVLYAALLSTIQATGQAVTLTFEFWPRTVANNVTAIISFA